MVEGACANKGPGEITKPPEHMEGPDGQQYEGQVVSGLPHGLGREIFEVSITYSQ